MPHGSSEDWKYYTTYVQQTNILAIEIKSDEGRGSGEGQVTAFLLYSLKDAIPLYVHF